jgi:tetratricopeptide (TPR) repeat protein
MKRAERLYRQGQFYLAKGDYEKAVKKFGESKSLSEMVGFKAGIANNLNEMGVILTHKREFAQARDLFSQTLTMYKDLEMASEVSKTLNNIALTYEGERNFRKAIQAYEELYEWDNATDNYIGMGLTLSHIGYIYKRHLKDEETAFDTFRESLPHFEKAVDAYWKAGSRSGMAKTLYDLGFVYQRYLEQENDALSKYEEALSLAKQTESKGLSAKILGTMAEVYASRREFPKASLMLREASQLYEELGMPKMVSKSMNNAALACVLGKDYRAAITQYEESVKWHQEIDDNLGVAVALNNLGLIYKNHLNRPGDAQKKFVEALEILKEIGNEKYIQIVEKNLVSQISPQYTAD